MGGVKAHTTLSAVMLEHKLVKVLIILYYVCVYADYWVLIGVICM